jgi:hypothetical protein
MTANGDPCDVVVERVALGEPLGELAAHVATCDRCRRLTALPTALGATHRDSEPQVGFASRMTVGAQEQLVARRRRRVVGATGAAVAATALLAFALTRNSNAPSQDLAPATRVSHDDNDREPTPTPTTDNPPTPPAPPAPTSDEAADEDVRALVKLANTGRSRRVSARWTRIERSLTPYRNVVQGVTP